MVPTSPHWMPAASSAATARNAVVVLPSVPVTPTTASSRLGSPYHHAAAAARARRARAHDELGDPDVGHRPLHDRGGRPGGRRQGDVVVAVDVLARDRHEDAARCDPARVVGDAADADRPERRGADRPAILAGAPQPGVAQAREALDEGLERAGLGGLAGR